MRRIRFRPGRSLIEELSCTWSSARGGCRPIRPTSSAGLEGIVAGVSRLPGLVSGFWTRSTDGLDSHTFIVFEGLDAAEAFASNVRANLDNQHAAGVENVTLTIEEIIARTSG